MQETIYIYFLILLKQINVSNNRIPLNQDFSQSEEDAVDNRITANPAGTKWSQVLCLCSTLSNLEVMEVSTQNTFDVLGRSENDQLHLTS